MGESIQNFIFRFREKYWNMRKTEELKEDVTQGFWQSLSLSERRCRRKNLRITYEVKGRGNNPGTITEEDEGNYRHFTYKRPVTLERTFYIGDRKVETIKENVDEECIVLQGKEETFQVVCPRCGAVANRESFIDGCDYCGSKFQIKQFGTKVAGYQFLHNFETDAKKMYLSVVIVLVLLILSLGGMAALRMMQNMFGVTSLSNTLLYAGCRLLKSVVSKLVIVCAMIAFISSAIAKKRTTMLSSKEGCEDFPFEEIATGLEYRLKQIHFAENVDEIQAFVQEDMRDYLPVYKDVIDLSLYRCLYTSYVKENGIERLGAYCSLLLLVEENGKIKKRKEHLWIGLRRNEHFKEGRNKLNYNICPNCGSTISLLNGGVCEYCGEQLNLMDYDWVIAGADTTPAKAAKVMSGKFFDERRSISKGLIIFSMILLLFQAPVVKGLGITTKNLVTGMYQQPMVFDFDVIPSPYDAGMDLRYVSIKNASSTYVMGDSDSKKIIRFGYVSNREEKMREYAAFLMKEDGFSVSTEPTEGAISLERSMRLNWGKTRVTIYTEGDFYLEVEQILY